MAGLLRFLIYNLAASLLAGVLAWLLVTAALRLLQVRSAFLHASFLALPLVKSILVLAGMGLAFPWPGGWFRAVQLQAVPPLEAIPFVLIWFGLAAGSHALFAWQARQNLLRQAIMPDGESARRLQTALQRVENVYHMAPCCEAGEILCCISDRIPDSPRLMLSAALRSPLALLEGGQPVVLFPGALLPELDDTELALALAHELNHFALRRPAWQAPGLVSWLVLASPIAFLLADYYHREEEKACDDLAVAIFELPEVYAAMLLKSYRFARRQPFPAWSKPLPFFPALLGAKSFLSERVERLLKPAPSRQSWANFPLVTGALWVALLYFLFLSRLGG
jgi:hypothetical protein